MNYGCISTSLLAFKSTILIKEGRFKRALVRMYRYGRFIFLNINM